ncbi:MAG: RHS repeat protein, partial [Planctomycetes bacterium]|nr:RHS repeat protein [Planctomycetota bacterium]
MQRTHTGRKKTEMSYTQRRRYQLFVYTMAVLLALPPGVFTSQVFANARTSTLSRESTMETFRNPQITRWNRFLGVDGPTEIAGGAGQLLRDPSMLGNVGDMGMTPFGLWLTNEGRMEWAERDLSFPGVGMNLTFERVWRGSVTTYDGPLGGEWEFSWNTRLFEDSGTDDVTVYEMGRTETYTESGGSYTSPVGRYDTLSKDTGPNPDVFTRTDKYGLVETYEDESSGWYRLVSIVDTNDNTLSFSYDGSSQLTSVSDTLSRDTTLAYDGSGRITSITDPASRSWTYSYDGSGNLLSVADPLSHATTYGYDASSRLTSVKQPQDSSASLVVYYDSTSPIPRVTRQTHNGSDFMISYDTTNRWVTVEDRAIANGETRYGYDASGRIISREIWEDTVGGSAAETAWTYNSDHEVTLVTFDRGNRVAYTYDGSGNIVTLQLQQSSGDTTSPTQWVYTYTSLNRVSTLTDPNGRTWDYDYDADGNLTQTTAPAVTLPSGIASADNTGNGTYDGTIVET